MRGLARQAQPAPNHLDRSFEGTLMVKSFRGQPLGSFWGSYSVILPPLRLSLPYLRPHLLAWFLPYFSDVDGRATPYKPRYFWREEQSSLSIVEILVMDPTPLGQPAQAGKQGSRRGSRS